MAPITNSQGGKWSYTWRHPYMEWEVEELIQGRLAHVKDAHCDPRGNHQHREASLEGAKWNTDESHGATGFALASEI